MYSLQLRKGVFYLTLLISLLAVTVGSIPAAREAVIFRTPFLDFVTSRLSLTDPMLGFILSIVAWLYLWTDRLSGLEKKSERATSTRRRQVAIYFLMGVGIACAFMALEYWVVESLWLKPSLGYLRPDQSMRLAEGPVTQWIGRLLGGSLAGGTSLEQSAPFGFMLRQTIVSLGILFLAVCIRPTEGASDAVRKRTGRWGTALSVFAVAMLIWTPFTRVYTGAHYVFDCMLALAIGVHLFWIVALLVLAAGGAAKFNPSELKKLGEMGLSLLPFALVAELVIFLLSADSQSWGLALPISMVLIAYVPAVALRRTRYAGSMPRDGSR